jgi:hypothetical protein
MAQTSSPVTCSLLTEENSGLTSHHAPVFEQALSSTLAFFGSCRSAALNNKEPLCWNQG